MPQTSSFLPVHKFVCTAAALFIWSEEAGFLFPPFLFSFDVAFGSWTDVVGFLLGREGGGGGSGMFFSSFHVYTFYATHFYILRVHHNNFGVSENYLKKTPQCYSFSFLNAKCF